MSFRLIRQVIREAVTSTGGTRSTRDIVTEIQKFIGMSRADQDGIWGEKTDEAVGRFIYVMMSDAEITPREIRSYELTSDWSTNGPRIRSVNGKFVSYSGNAESLLIFLKDLAGVEEDEQAPAQLTPAQRPTTASVPSAPAQKSSGAPSKKKKVLAVGDSQMGAGIGLALRRHLETVDLNGDGSPDYVVTFVDGAGKNAKVILELFNQNFNESYYLVVTTIGGNGSSPSMTLSAINTMYDKVANQRDGYLIAVAAPPATLITSETAGVKSWGAAAKNPRYMLDRDRGGFAANRIAVSDTVDAMNLPYTLTYGVATRRAGIYPDQPDGLHCTVGGAEIAQDIITQARAKGIPI